MNEPARVNRDRIDVLSGLWQGDDQVRDEVNSQLRGIELRGRHVLSHDLRVLLLDGAMVYVSVVRYRTSEYEGLPSDEAIIHDEPGSLGESGRSLEYRSYWVTIEPGIHLAFECPRDASPAIQTGYFGSGRGGDVILPGRVVLVKAKRKPKEVWDRATLLGVDFQVPVIEEGSDEAQG